MKIIISNTPQDENSISMEEANSIRKIFQVFNIDPSTQQILSVIDEFSYQNIKQFGMDNSFTTDHLYQTIVQLLTNDYKTKNEKFGNPELFLKEVYFEARQQRFHKFKNDESYIFTPEEKATYITNKLNYFKDIEDQRNRLKNDTEGQSKRKQVIYSLMKQDYLDPITLEKEITGNNISLTDAEMDAFIIKISKQNKKSS